MSIENQKNKRYRALMLIYGQYIEPAINEGEFQCTFESDKNIDPDILDCLNELGYEAHYGQTCYDQRDGYVMDKTKLIINW